MKKFVLPLTLALSLALPISAMSATTETPTECPGIDSIVSAGLATTDYLPKYEVYAASNMNTYQTKFTWGFAIPIPDDQAVDKQDAENKAIAAFKSLTGTPSPAFDDGHWYCLYSNDFGYMSVAITPIE